MNVTDEEFISSVKYFWREKSDPTRYMGWDEERCRKLLPRFYYAWLHYTAALADCDDAF